MLDAYLRYYNEERPKEGLGWTTPMQYPVQRNTRDLYLKRLPSPLSPICFECRKASLNATASGPLGGPHLLG